MSLIFSGCTDGQIFETKTVGVGQEVTLTCDRDKSIQGNLFWIRIVSGNSPDFLGRTSYFDSSDNVKSMIPHITAKQGPGTFLLHIRKPELSDAGLYYCLKVKDLFDLTFLKGTFLRIGGKYKDSMCVHIYRTVFI